MDDLQFTADLGELRFLADRVIAALTPCDDDLLFCAHAYNPTIYSQCRPKPRWPYSASDTFDQLWASL